MRGNVSDFHGEERQIEEFESRPSRTTYPPVRLDDFVVFSAQHLPLAEKSIWELEPLVFPLE